MKSLSEFNNNQNIFLKENTKKYLFETMMDEVSFLNTNIKEFSKTDVKKELDPIKKQIKDKVFQKMIDNSLNDKEKSIIISNKSIIDKYIKNFYNEGLDKCVSKLFTAYAANKWGRTIKEQEKAEFGAKIFLTIFFLLFFTFFLWLMINFD